MVNTIVVPVYICSPVPLLCMRLICQVFKGKSQRSIHFAPNVVFPAPSGQSSDAASGQSVALRYLQPEGHRGPVRPAAEGDPRQELCQLLRVL